jgi:hypothetical protein
VEQVFKVTQDWNAEEVVAVFEVPKRPISVGDVVVSPMGGIYRCERCGWSFIEWDVFQVWHAKDNMFAGVFPDEYVHVADVPGSNLDHVYGVTQDWWSENNITFFEEPRRPTDFADVVVSPTGGIYICEPAEWRFVAWLQ